jgi:hypothetical protein
MIAMTHIWALRRTIRQILGAHPTAALCRAVAAELKRLAAELEADEGAASWAEQWEQNEGASPDR